MTEYRLSFVTLLDYEDGIIEIIVDEGVDVSADQFSEMIKFINELPSNPKGGLVNRVHSYSISFAAHLRFKESNAIEWVAECLHGRRPNPIIKSVWPKKLKLQFYSDRETALQWLKASIKN